MKADANIDYCNLYLNWLKENIEQFKVNDSTFRLTMPFLDRNNDHIEIYIIKKDENSYCITDDGATLNELQFSGFEVGKSDRRKGILDSVTSAHGVTVQNGNELTINCTINDLAMKKHMLAQCMMKVSDMFYLSKPNVQSVFLDDVQGFLDLNDVRYSDNIFFTGKSKLMTHYDFVIGKSKKSSERLIKVVNNMDLNAARNVIFAWNDIREMRQHDSKLYAFIQDEDRKVSPDAVGALQEYGITPALWTEKEKYIAELIA